MELSTLKPRFTLVRSGAGKDAAETTHAGAPELDLELLRAEMLRVVDQAQDPAPPSQIKQRAGEGGHDTRFQCEAVERYLAEQGFDDEQRLEVLTAVAAATPPPGRQEGLIINNLIARYHLAKGNVREAMNAAEAAFQSWHMDIYNHQTIVACRSRLGLLGGETEESIQQYLETVYCDRPFDFLATTVIDKVYLCSTNYLTAPAADLQSAETSMDDDPAVAAEKAWNSPAAQHIRRSVISGEFNYCSALTCPRIQNRDLPKRKMDQLPPGLADWPHLIEFGDPGYNIFYYRSRMYAVPTGLQLLPGTPLELGVLVSYTLDDLRDQIDAATGVTGEPLGDCWFRENGLSDSAVLTLSAADPQYEMRSKMRRSPREIILSHDNSCNISCPSCRTETIIASKELNAKHDRLIPLLLGLIKEADFIVCSGSGDPFASRHFRRLLAAVGGREFEQFGPVQKRPDFRVDLMTNGLQFTRRAYEQLGLRGLIGNIALSMDACEPVSFESIRRGSKWSDLVDVLEFLQTIRHENPQFHLGSYFTVQAENFRYLPDFVEFCRKYRFD